MKNFVFVITDTKDKFELPFYVCDTALEVANKLGISRNAVNKRLRENRQSNSRYVIEKIEV